MPGHSATVLAPVEAADGSYSSGTDADLVRRVRWEPTDEGRQSLAWKEWLVTNGLGGYASGTVPGR